MKSEKSLFKLPSFWFWGLVPLIIAILLGYKMYDSTSMLFDFDYDGVVSFVQTFKIPISISALSFPLIALIATNHRSEQSAHQIKLAMEQNSFTNYFKHKEEFNKFIISLEKELHIEFIKTNEFYNNIFSNSSKYNQDFMPSAFFLNTLKFEFDKLKELITQYDGNLKPDDIFKELSIKSSEIFFFKYKKIPINYDDNRTRDYSPEKEELEKYTTIYKVIINLYFFCDMNKFDISPLEEPNQKFNIAIYENSTL